MRQAPVGPDDADRVTALRSYEVLDSTRERAYDEIVASVASICRVPVALISLIDVDRMWIKALFGRFEASMDRARSFCGHAIAQPSEMLVVDDASSDLRFYDNPFVIGEPFIRFYAGCPLVSNDGFVLGALCAVDVVPRSFSESERATLRLAARCVVALLEERRARGRLERMLGERRKLVCDNRDLAGEIERRALVEQRLLFAARHDPLTNLPNRGYFVERLRARIATGPTLRGDVPFAVMFVDVDHFKVVNDTFGHALGDELLIAFARRLAHLVRGDDLVARLGGDEFTVLIDVTEGPASLAHLAERLGRAVAVPFRLEGADVQVSASVGIVVATGAYERTEDLLRDADAAMFAAKSAGRNRYEFFHGDRLGVTRV